MTLYPLMIEGAALRALIVGGGSVALRKTRSLLEAGASVRLVAPRVHAELRELEGPHLELAAREYSSDDIGDATLVIAATSSREVNAAVARDANWRGRFVNVVDAPGEGNCVTPATHRTGELVIAVVAGGVPSVAARIRDEIAERYDGAYANAIGELASVRGRLLAAGQRARWTEVVDAVVGTDFCDAVERGELAERLAPWR